MGVSGRLRAAAANLAVAILALATLAPLGWMVAVSLMAKGESTRVPVRLWPDHPTLFHYRQLFTDYHLGRPILNSLALGAASTALALALTVPAGYAFAKLRFSGRDALLKLLLGLLVVPGQVAILPLFLMLRNLGLVNSYLGALVPSLAAPFAVLFIRQMVLRMPDEMLDAARVDGASERQVFLRVVLPLLRPAVATLALLVFMSNWNDFLWPLIVLADQRLYTLPVALAALSREHGADSELMMAGALVTTLPVMLLFLLLQRHYIAGLLAGGLKG